MCLKVSKRQRLGPAGPLARCVCKAFQRDQQILRAAISRAVRLAPVRDLARGIRRAQRFREPRGPTATGTTRTRASALFELARRDSERVRGAVAAPRFTRSARRT